MVILARLVLRERDELEVDSGVLGFKLVDSSRASVIWEFDTIAMVMVWPSPDPSDPLPRIPIASMLLPCIGLSPL